LRFAQDGGALYEDDGIEGRAGAPVRCDLVQIAKESELNSFLYLTYLFEKLPNLTRQTEEAIEQLLPW
jgi:hypothetical protein